MSLAGGINILESGQTWLAKHLTGRRVWFKPLRITSDDRLECIVHTRMVSMSVPLLLSVCLCVCVCGNQVMYLLGFVALFACFSVCRITHKVVEFSAFFGKASVSEGKQTVYELLHVSGVNAEPGFFLRILKM